MVTNQYIRTGQTTANLNVSQGEPFNFAVLVDDTNLADAVWSPYTSSSITLNLGSTEGWHFVWVGLTGHAPSSTPTWQSVRLKYDPCPAGTDYHQSGSGHNHAADD